MPDLDEDLFTAAKLYEQVAGDLDGDRRLLDHAGLPVDDGTSKHLSFLKTALGDDWSASRLAEASEATIASGAASRAVTEGDATALSYLVGVTETELDGSSLRLPLQLNAAMDNNDATAFIGGAGNPNTGKTNLVALLTELRRATVDDLLVISNSRTWPGTDELVTSAHDLAVTCLEHRDRPKFVFIDEGSTHFDARTHSREVAVQFTPLAKRFAKIGVDVFATVGHTGKDLHPEVKRLLTLAFFKTEKKSVDFYGNWPADADMPTDRLFGGTVEELEPALEEPDPDDAAPWAWNLEAELFARDLDWSELLDRLRTGGPPD
ncbi:hypothetical protein [Haloplanus salinarum]|uniref:hypothetical protein n=1 Tax=Haloplanus salinarum TaxID=1912324 RepID=UPI00214B95E4|nr:hypothetical protein [Haloplanus salinarum]